MSQSTPNRAHRLARGISVAAIALFALALALGWWGYRTLDYDLFYASLLCTAGVLGLGHARRSVLKKTSAAG